MAMAHPTYIHGQPELRSSCQQCSLSNLCLPLALDDDELNRLENIVQQGQIFNRGDTIFDQKAPFRSCFAIKSGAVKTLIVNANGEEQITGFFMPGEIIGLDSMGSEYHACAARALERTTVCEFPVDRLAELTTQLPDLQHHMYHLMSQEIQGSHQLAMMLSKQSAEERIAALLLSMSSRFERRSMSGSSYILPMPRVDIANFLGLAVETVSRIFSRFQSQGTLSAHGRKIELIDIGSLKATARGLHKKSAPPAPCRDL